MVSCHETTMTNTHLIAAADRAAQTDVTWTDAFMAAYAHTRNWDESMAFAWKVVRQGEAARMNERTENV